MSLSSSVSPRHGVRRRHRNGRHGHGHGGGGGDSTTGTGGGSVTMSMTMLSDDDHDHEAYHQKKEQIESLLAEPVVDLWALRALALSEGGLLNGTYPYRTYVRIVGKWKMGGGWWC